MRYCIIIIGLCWGLMPSFLCAQEVTNQNVEQQLEDLANADETETEDDSYLQQLNQLQRNKLNLNTATQTELQVFRFLNDLLISQFLQYRKVVGPLLSLYELQAVPNWDPEIIQRLVPFVYVGPSVSTTQDFLSRFRGGNHSIVMRVAQVLERSRGFTPDENGNTRYLGSPQRVFFRYKYVFKNTLQFGIVGDKDPGENLFKGAQKRGFDFYSMHLFARDLGIVKRLAIGDYTVNIGQGLLTYQSLAFRKSVDAMNIKRQTEIFRPYNSAGEFFFHRGAAITLGGDKLSVSAFVNNRKVSANAVVDTANFEDFVSSLLTSGLNRTPNEIEDRNTIREFSAGGAIQYKIPRFQVGLNGVHYELSKPLQRSSLPYNNFRFSGKTLTALSMDYSYTYRNMHIFGEVAGNPGGGMAQVHGLIASLDRTVDFSLLYRNISKNYHTLYGNAFTESTTPNNEKGLYTGISIKPWRFLKLDAYADVFQFDWLRFRVDRPSKGREYLVQLTWKPNRNIEVYTRYRTEKKALNYTMPTEPANITADIPRQNFRVHMSYKVSQAVTLRARAESVWWDKGGPEEEQGFMVYTDFFYKPLMNPLALNFRLQFYETDGFNSRLYAYENDVLYSFSIPPLSGKAFRWYTNVNYDITRKVTVWFRLARSFFPEQITVGSGNDLIQKNHRTDYRFQIRYSF